MANCQAQLQASIQTYYLMVGASLALTATNVGLYGICLKRPLEGSPALAAQFFFVTGSIKILLGVLILSLFLPKCPDGCSCDLSGSAAFYPCIAILVGLLWIRRGQAKLRMARALEGTPDSNGVEAAGKSDVAIFSPVSTNDEVV